MLFQINICILASSPGLIAITFPSITAIAPLVAAATKSLCTCKTKELRTIMSIQYFTNTQLTFTVLQLSRATLRLSFLSETTDWRQEFLFMVVEQHCQCKDFLTIISIRNMRPSYICKMKKKQHKHDLKFLGKNSSLYCGIFQNLCIIKYIETVIIMFPLALPSYSHAIYPILCNTSLKLTTSYWKILLLVPVLSKRPSEQKYVYKWNS